MRYESSSLSTSALMPLALSPPPGLMIELLQNPETALPYRPYGNYGRQIA